MTTSRSIPFFPHDHAWLVDLLLNAVGFIVAFVCISWFLFEMAKDISGSLSNRTFVFAARKMQRLRPQRQDRGN